MTSLFLIRLFIEIIPKQKKPTGKAEIWLIGGSLESFCNVAFPAKLVAGLLTASISITADALNNLFGCRFLYCHSDWF